VGSSPTGATKFPFREKRTIAIRFKKIMGLRLLMVSEVVTPYLYGREMIRVLSFFSFLTNFEYNLRRSPHVYRI